jgi:hypothetical protein
MKKYLYIQNRQSGKTTLGLYEHLKNPENSLFIFLKREMCDKIINQHNLSLIERKNIISINSLPTFIRSKEFNKIIVDEYFFFNLKQRKSLYSIFPNLTDNGEIYLFSTPNRIYSLSDIQRIKEMKENKENPKTDDEDLYYNFLTDSDVIIYHNKFYNKNIYKQSFLLSNNQIETEINGNYLN